MTRTAMIGGIALLAFGAQSALACSVPRIRTLNNQTVTGQMTTKSGQPCRINMRSSNAPTFTIEVVQRPSNGSVQLGGMQSISYRSRSGFVGNDSFTYARHG